MKTIFLTGAARNLDGMVKPLVHHADNVVVQGGARSLAGVSDETAIALKPHEGAPRMPRGEHPGHLAGEPPVRQKPSESIKNVKHEVEGELIIAFVEEKVDDSRQRSRVRWVQEQLQARGFAPGPIDGIPGLRTRQALSLFQHDRGLPVTGELDAATIQALE
jgi:hypothetical protein